jgi:hypothetical protein
MPDYIETMDNLLQSREDVPQETIDAFSLNPLSHPTAFIFPLRRWASVGFPPEGNLFLITLNSPSPCPDGTPRTLYDYISYLIAADLDKTISDLNVQFQGFSVKYILTTNVLQIVATRD